MNKERGYPIYVEYWPQDWPHGHMLLIADGSVPPRETWAEVRSNMESYAEELAEAILVCNEGRHGGRGHVHSYDDARKAFQAAMDQLLTRDYAKEWAEQEFKQRMFAKWGGHMPAAVLSFHPEDPTQETLMVPDKNGDPVFYSIPKKRGILSQLFDHPREGKNAVRHPTGLGWMTKLQWKKR